MCLQRHVLTYDSFELSDGFVGIHDAKIHECDFESLSGEAPQRRQVHGTPRRRGTINRHIAIEIYAHALPRKRRC
jgi:hypothetical protein